MADDSNVPDDAQLVPRVPPEELAPRLGVGRLSRHVFVCGGPSCCSKEEGQRTWGTIKRAAAAINLQNPDGPQVFRTRCECLRMCDQGPIVVIYPEGIWYKRVTPTAAQRVMNEHARDGRPVEDLIFARDSLGFCPSENGSGGFTVGDDERSQSSDDRT